MERGGTKHNIAPGKEEKGKREERWAFFLPWQVGDSPTAIANYNMPSNVGQKHRPFQVIFTMLTFPSVIFWL